MPNCIAAGRDARWIAFALVAAACTNAPGDEMMNPDGVLCAREDDDGPSTATPLSGSQQGQLCPIEDQDWYRFTLGANERLVSVKLSLPTMRSPIEPTYAIWTANGNDAGQSVATPDPERVGDNLEVVHCLPAGDYFLAVRDQNDDAEDLRNRYTLELTTAPEPDTHEPNQDSGTATAATFGQENLGHVSCAGDQDWYAVDVPPDTVLRVRLSMPQARLQPTVRLVDAAGQQLLVQSNLAGATRDTFIDLFRVLPRSGRWYVVVQDDDGRDADGNVGYSLLVEAVADGDPNEPNNHPDEATALPMQTCADGWSGTLERTGTIGSPSDNDWFALPLTGCSGGVLEADLFVHGGGGLAPADAWTLQTTVQASISIVRADASSPCNDDDDCRVLSGHACNDHLDCANFFDSCQSEGLCSGAAVCTPGGACGANQLERHYTRAAGSGSTTQAPPPNEARASMPIFGDDRLFIRVADYQNDGGAPTAFYTLRVRVRRDPDPQDRADPNNVFLTRLTNELPVREMQAQATTLQVRGPGGCASPDAFTSGAISYENDLDWFRYDHPCPNADCMVRVHYQVEDGPVDHYLGIYEGGSDWFAKEAQSGTSGSLGGPNECFYAFQGHRSSPYYILIRDIAEPTRNWSADQTYRICVERAADGCQAPCVVAPNGECDSP